MRIFLTSGDNPYQKQVGGKHIHQLLYEKALKELGHQVDLCYPLFAKRKKIVTALKLIGNLLPLNSYGFLKYRLSIDACKIFEKEIAGNNQTYDILHAQDPISLLLTKNIKSKKRIVTLHGYFTKESINYSRIPQKYIQRFQEWGKDFEKKAYQLADHFICVDSTIKDYLINEFSIPESKISVIFNAIDTVRFMPSDTEEIMDLKKRYGFAKKQFIILVPRRLVKKNGVHVAITSIKNMTDQNILLLIAGDGPERKSLEEEAGNDQRIRFLGSINHDQVIDYFKIADCVLIPSITSDGFQEATSLAMLEGMSMCKPTVCSAIGGMKEVIKHGITGFLVEEQNPTAIANQISWIIQNEEEVKKITFNARNYILENHHYISHAKKILKFY